MSKPKSKKKLDRKTRRAIENLVNQQVNQANTGSAKKSSFSLNSSGYITGTGMSSGVSFGSLGSAKASKADPIELPPITGQLHVSRYYIDDLRFHLRVFDEGNPQIDYTLVARSTEPNEISFDQLAFYSEADKLAFEGWMDRYLEKFGKHTDLLLPPPLDGAYPHTLRSNFNRKRAATAQNSSFNNAVSSDDLVEEQMLEQWVWILDNCEGEVRHAGAFWFFAENSDATLFKMAYS